MPHLPPAGSGTISLATPEPVSFADTVTFATTGTEDLKNPLIYVTAFQDAVLVYGELGAASVPFKLGGGSSVWVQNGGGPADCHAELRYIPNKNGNGEWNGHGDQGEPVVLATCDFHAEG